MSHTPASNGSTQALIGMVLSIVGLVGIVLCCCSPVLTSAWCGLFGLPAVILGYLARKEMRKEMIVDNPNAENMAIIALVLGSVEVIVALLGICLLILTLLGVSTLSILEEAHLFIIPVA